MEVPVTRTYKALERGYVDGRLIEAGETFATSAPKGDWMEPEDDPEDGDAPPRRGRPPKQAA